LRVVGGRLSGRVIRCPPGVTTRPTLDRVRESLFNILAPRVAGAFVLDLYAGTGALAFEALSRGADHAAVVEPDPRALGVLRTNVVALGLEASTTIYPVRAELAVKRLPNHSFHLIFLDPPWDRGPSVDVWRRLGGLLHPEGLAVLEFAHPHGVPPLNQGGVVEVDRRQYGRTGLLLLAPAG